MRYHKKVFTKQEHIDKLHIFTQKLNGKKWRYTRHALDKIKYRDSDLESVLRFIKDAKLNADDVFEYYLNDIGNIRRACYRLKFNALNDIVIVIGKRKQLITMYYNSTDDEHETLQKELYTRG